MKNVFSILAILLILGLSFSIIAESMNSGQSESSSSSSPSSSSSGSSSSSSDASNSKSSDQSSSSKSQDSSSSKTTQRESQNTGSSDKSSSKTSSENSNSGDSNSEKKVEKKTEEINGKKVETTIKIKNGKTEIVEKTVYIDEAGNKVTIKQFSVDSEGVDKTTTVIKVKGAEVNTKLTVTEKINQNGDVTIKARLSSGAEQDINILPDEALKKALEELQTTNGFTFELKEVQKDEKTIAVFEAKAKKTGKILGLFNTQINLETLIDTQTGEIIKTTKPWWSFLMVGYDTEIICHIDNNQGTNVEVKLTEVKEHLEHGDGIGECPEVCGDGLKTDLEECDDGNAVNGDGCSEFCIVETPCECADTICPENEEVYFLTLETGETSCECLSEPIESWSKVTSCPKVV